MHIYIPTRGRDRVATIESFPSQLHSCITLVIGEEDEHLIDTYPSVNHHVTETHGIAKVRQEIGMLAELEGRDKFMMMDDDLRFFRRKSDDDWKLRGLRSKEFKDMLKLLSLWLDEDDVCHCAISAREGNNRVSQPYVENTRMLRALAYRTFEFNHLAEHDRVPVMEDFDVTLQLLKMGFKNRVSYEYAQDQGSSNAPGGCSTYRDQEMQHNAACKMVVMHPTCVRMVSKKTKTAWNGGKRTDVVIQWKKAYAQSEL